MKNALKSPVAVALVLAWASTSFTEVVFADLVPETIWAQPFTFTVEGSPPLQFDHLQMCMLPTDSWEAPTGIAAFNDANWHQTWNDGALLIADGPDLAKLDFTLYFASNPSEPFDFHFQAWDGLALVHSADVKWSGSQWSIEPGTWDTGRIPEPATIATLTCGLLLLVRRPGR